MYTLRPHQVTAIEGIRNSYKAGHKRPVLQAVPGFGKTLCAVDMIKQAIDKGKRVCFIVDRIILIEQTSREFDKFGLDHGIIQGQNPRTNDLPLQIASTQTLAARVKNSNVYNSVLKDNQFPFDWLIVDECHTQSRALNKLMLTNSQIPVLGLSGSPWAKGMGQVYDDLILAESTQNLIDKGFLSDFVAYGSPLLDLKGVKTVAGDYNQKEIAQRASKAKIVGDVVKTWLQRGENRQTMCFAINVAHSKAIIDEFRANGVTAAHIDAHTTYDDRIRILKAHNDGELKILSNVGITTKGFDSPQTTCLILARPTKSMMLYIQMINRVLRVSSCGKDAIILDHGRNIERLGLPTDQMQEYLCDGDPDLAEKKKKEKEREKAAPKPCPKCYHLHTEFICPACGYKPELMHDIESTEDKLQKI
ncbi:MAG: DEAD/DEAH box helicase, partial [Gammaproteobacteria bacterium]|nr:DEAD/DEAH box helicase [Gammaproteobacteria bacterium]